MKLNCTTFLTLAHSQNSSNYLVYFETIEIAKFDSVKNFFSKKIPMIKTISATKDFVLNDLLLFSSHCYETHFMKSA